MIIVIVPLLSYAIAVVTLPLFSARGLVPYEFTTMPLAPDWLWKFVPRLAWLVEQVISHYNIKAHLALALIYTIFLGGFLALVYAILYQVFGPSRYGPMDAPPPKVKVKKYTR
ncbi:MAG: hypothetical protein ACOYYJ_02020 [Chloroflexota bacterium]